MPDKNKSKLLIGISFLLAAFLFSTVVLYFMGRKNEENAKEIASLQVQLTNLMNDKSRGTMLARDVGRTTREPVALDDVLSRSEKIYGKAEMNRKEGVLWIDQSNAVCLVTLGKVNGLDKGSRLDIFEGDTKIGVCLIDNPLDIVSYVSIAEKPISDFKNSYYRVVKESP